MGLLGWITGNNGEGTDAAAPPRPRLSMERAGDILRHFPVGSRVGYYPEYQRSIRLETLVLGYWINGESAYARHDLGLRGSGEGATLRLRSGGAVREFDRLDQFSIVIPHSSRSELDYAEDGGRPGEGMQEKEANDFRRANSVTLFNRGVNGMVPYLDTAVARVLDLKDGIHANRRVVLLDPDPESFELFDQRRHQRIFTRIPAALGIVADQMTYPCQVLDFSEKGFRLGWGDEAAPAVKPGTRLFLRIPMEHERRTLHLRGNVLRIDEKHLVLAPTAIWRERRFQTLDPLDELEIKTGLLHHPATAETNALDPVGG